MSEQLGKAIEELQAAMVALDLAEAKYLKFADYNNPSQQIAYARYHKPMLQAAERRLDAACEALKAAGWVKPKAFLPAPESVLGSPVHTVEQP